MNHIKEKKQRLRKKVNKRVASLELEYCKEADQQIFFHATNLSEYKNAETVFCYVGRKEEIDTLPILKDILEKGKRLGVPRCIEKGVMKVYEIKSLKELEVGAYGILEPCGSCICIEQSEIDIAFVPCLSSSIEGRRLGYGGGYYDRYLEKTGFTRIVLCREQIIEKEVPVDKHDQKMDIVISEKEIYRI